MAGINGPSMLGRRRERQPIAPKLRILNQVRGTNPARYDNGNDVDRSGLRSLLDSGNISQECLDNAIKQSVLEEARFSARSLERGADPRELSNPEFLAYGLENNTLINTEVNPYLQNSGMTVEEFCQTYGQKDLIDSRKKALLD